MVNFAWGGDPVDAIYVAGEKVWPAYPAGATGATPTFVSKTELDKWAPPPGATVQYALVPPSHVYEWDPVGRAWKESGGQLAGLAGWADVTAVTGNPTKHEYTDAQGFDWTAYEWTGNGSVTVTVGLVDTLLAGHGDDQVAGAGGEVLSGLIRVVAGVIPVVVPSVKQFHGQYYESSQLGSRAARPGFGNGAQGAGFAPSPGVPLGQSDQAGVSQPVVDSITGSPVRYAGASDFTAGPYGPGSGGNVASAAQRKGCVIIRVPRANAKA